MTTTRPPGMHPTPVRPRFYRRAWVVATLTAVLALVLGTVIGIRAADATKSPEYRAQADDLAAAESELAFAKASLEDATEAQTDAEDTAADAQDRLDTFEGQLDERRAALKKREAALKKRTTALDKRAARLKEKAANLLEREDAVTAAEELIEDTTVPGDGSFQVGVDIERGLYKSPGRRGCRYTVFGDAEGNDILLDNTTPGPASVSLRDGTWFTTRGCAEWTRQ
jgi:multidrug efflux pump subunit AcrA (membrane-fusion protein)